MENEAAVKQNQPDSTVLEERLARMEELLEQQAQTNAKLLKNAKARSVAMIIFIVIFAVTAVLISGVAFHARDAIDELSASAARDLDAALEVIEGLNIDDLNEAITGIDNTAKGLEAINFNALNDSIEALRIIVMPLAQLLGG